MCAYKAYCEHSNASEYEILGIRLRISAKLVNEIARTDVYDDEHNAQEEFIAIQCVQHCF